MISRGRLRGLGKEVVSWAKKYVAYRNIADRTPILVYQMGKVGSSTVSRTLEGMKGAAPVIQIHSLNPEVVEGNAEALRSDLGYLHEHVVASMLLVDKDLDWGGFPCKIVTLTREPVGRAISFAFQDWRRQLTDVDRLQELDSDRMMKLVRKKLRPGGFHANPGQWFERELKAVFGIDVMSVPYDFDRGYVKICRGPVEVLVIRMEDLNRSLERGLADLFDLEEGEVQMVRSNVGREKKYADLLTEVKEQLVIPPSVGERVWSTDYVQHFYGPDVECLRKKWGA